MAFLGILGSLPCPENEMALEISPSDEKREKWGRLIKSYIELGVITREQLGSSVGKLSFPQTSIFGRFGIPLLCPLYQKLNAPKYHPLLSGREIRAPQWWAAALKYQRT